MKFAFYNTETGETVREWDLNPSQERFMRSKKKFVLFSGGYGCGKSLVLTLKAMEHAAKYPKDYILMGRKTYPELRDTLMKEFFDIVPDELIKDYLKAEGRCILKNGSEIIFRHLDTIAESEIRSLNLGAAFIDQAEDISREVVMGLRGRLRREGISDDDRQIFMSANPALTWLYSDFKQNPSPEYELIEASTLENAKNLPESYVADLLKYPEAYKKQYVYGVWDSDLLADRVVFAREYLERIRLYAADPIASRDGLDIYAEYVPGHRYQMGIDSSEGIVEQGVAPEKQRSDESAITIVDLTTEEEVASWSGRLTPDVVAEKATRFARMYQDTVNPILVVPEMNAMGLAILNSLHKEPDIRLYRREEFDVKTGFRLEKEGWRTTRQTKPLLVSRFQEMLRLREPKVRSRKTYEQFKTFVYTDEAKTNGMGAELGFHDDRLISLLLAFWEKGPVVPGKVLSPHGNSKSDTPFLKVARGGKLVIRFDKPELRII